jgi:hypothetical protein
MKAALGPIAAAGLALLPAAAFAGPPYFTDDPVPAEHYEVYLFGAGTLVPGGADSEIGIDLNYGATPNLQLTVEAPFLRDADGASGLGNIKLAAKYRFLTQDDFGLDVAVFPHLILPSVSSAVGDRHMGVFLPVWAQRDFGKWSIFGGGGCTLNHTRFSNDFCEAGLAVTREIDAGLRLGAEIFHSGPETPDGKANTALGAGLAWDIDDHHHLLGYWGPDLAHPDANGRSNFYAALLFTF